MDLVEVSVLAGGWEVALEEEWASDSAALLPLGLLWVGVEVDYQDVAISSAVPLEHLGHGHIHQRLTPPTQHLVIGQVGIPSIPEHQPLLELHPLPHKCLQNRNLISCRRRLKR